MRLRIPQRVAIGVGAMALFAALPAVAGATDYCVSPNVGCGGTNVANFQHALDLADNASDADRIFLGAYKYVAPTTSGFDYSKAGAPVEIIGKGAGQTILTAPSGASNVLRLFSGGGNSIHDLRIGMPASAAPQAVGLSTDGVARQIDVVEDGSQQYNRRGVYLENGGTLEDSSVILPAPTDTTAVWIDAGGGTVRGVTASAYAGVVSSHGGTIERTRFVGGVGIVGGATVTSVKSSLLFVAGPGVGILANPIPGADTTINADGLTIVGAGRVSSQAAVVNTNFGPAQNADINLTNSIIRDSKFEAIAAGAGHARIAVSYSDLDPADNELTGAPNASITLANTTNVGDPGFADPKLLDYHLLPSSPLIDAGDPNAANGVDMDGKARIIDGDVDGSARRDMGAFEYQTGLPQPGDPAPQPPAGSTPSADTVAPLVGGFRAAPSVFALGRASTPAAARVPRGTRFHYTLSEPASVTVTLQRVLPGRRSGGRCVTPSQRLRRAKRCTRHTRVGTLQRNGAKGANSIRFTGRIGKRALKAGRYRALISATDAAGNRSAVRSAAFRIAPS